ncbi:scavenger receptor cysteine-rich type 1 protein M130-like [Salvelinus alpinus]
MKMQKSVSVGPLLLLLCLSGVGVTKGQGVEVTEAVEFRMENEVVKTPADRKADGQTDSEPDLWAELRGLRDMVVEQRVGLAVTQSQLEDVKTQNADLQAQSVSPPAELSVRLVNGTTSCSGTVEVFYRGEWSGLCSRWWRMIETKVVCRELDCGNPVAESRGPLIEEGRGGVTLLSCDGDESSIRQCDIIEELGFCDGGYYHRVTCSESVRLVDGAGLCSGRVEVKSNQSWASVCEADFDRQDAEVVCGELGCGAPAALQGGLYGGGEGQTWDKEFQCKGNESLLLDCDTSDRKHNICLPGNAVGLTCSEPDDVRLLGGGSRCAGGVERYDQGEWRIVGADWKKKDEAAVVCRQLGCGSTVSVLPGNTTRGNGVYCSGSESSLRECSRMYDLLPGLTVICSDLQAQSVSPPAEHSVRLVDGTTSCSGTVEVFYEGEWSGLCSSWWWRMKETKVVCRELDCGNPVAESRGRLIEEGRRRVRLGGCYGDESSIRHCDIIEEPGYCYGEYYHHVTCSDLQAQSVSPPAELSVRLVDGTTSCSGTVEVFSRGEWSGLCSSWWSMMRETKVFCRELDCGNPVAESGGPLIEDGRRGVTLYGSCSGNESSIEQCVVIIIVGGRGVCIGEYYHHVTCSESVRLVDGAGLCSGRVEVKSSQSWASVCEADFDRQDAEVVCGELGCGAPAALQGGLYGGGEGQTWDKEFQCKGNESLLLDCDTSDRKHNTCLPGNAVGLTCSEPDDVRLVGGGSRCTGGVERYDQGEWRIVGASDWNQRNVAAVVCRQLGCGSTVSVPPGYTTRGNGVYCSGSESSLRECVRMYYPRPGLTVICSDLQAQRVRPTAEDSVRLVNGTTSCSGTVEVFAIEEWLGLCPGGWSMRETKVVCRQLNCGNPVSESRVLVEDGRRGVRIYSSSCSGHESSIGQCGYSAGISGVCDGGYYHHVTCSESVRLVDGAGLCSGRVEVKSNQSWASVCEPDFDRQDAEVVCRELGCGAPAALQGGLYGGGEGQTWDKDFQCKGKESLLLDCDTSDRKHNTCLPGNAVGLTCSEPDDVRLVGGGSRCAGGVERYDQGEWRTVGTADRDQEDVAAVVCRQLGCGSTVSVLPGNTTRGFRVHCSGSESSLRECSRTSGCLSGFTVICSDLLVQPDISLTDSMGGVSRGHQGPEMLWGHSFTITCSTQPQYPGGSFLLTFTGSNRTQTQPAVNHSAAFLFPAADDSHQGNYSCVYENYVFSHNFSSESELLSLTITDLLVQPDISLTDSMGGVSRGHQGPEMFRGYSFSITCSTQPQYPGGSFLLTFTGSNRTQTQPAVNHSAAFLFPAADDSHQGNYSCVYDNYVFSHNFSSESELLSLTITASPLPAFIIRHVVVLLLLLTAITTSYLYYKPTRRQKRVNRVSSMDLYVNAMEMVSLSSRAEAGPGEERAAQGTE